MKTSKETPVLALSVGTAVIERRCGVSQSERDAHQGHHESLIFSATAPEKYTVAEVGKQGKMVKLHSDLHGDTWVTVQSVVGGSFHSSTIGHTSTLTGPYEVVGPDTAAKDAEWHGQQRTRGDFRDLKFRFAKA